MTPTGTLESPAGLPDNLGGRRATTLPAPPAPPPTRAGKTGGAGPTGPTGPTAFAAEPGESVTGIPAYGTLIQVLADPGPPEVYVNIEGVGDITGPNTSIAEAETTSHSTGAPVRTFIPTLIDPGELSFPCFWNPADPTQSSGSPYGLESLFWGRVITKFQLVNTDPTHRTRQFRGFVKTIGETYPLAGIMTRNAAIRITSPLTDVATPIALDPVDADVIALGGTETFAVKTGGSNAPWQAISAVPWITVDTPVGATVGDEDVSITVANNLGVARVGHVDIAALNLSFEVNQAGT